MSSYSPVVSRRLLLSFKVTYALFLQLTFIDVFSVRTYEVITLISLLATGRSWQQLRQAVCCSSVLGKAQAGSRRRECFCSEQNNSCLSQQFWKDSAFFFYPPSLSSCFTNTRLCRNIWGIGDAVLHAEMFLDQMTCACPGLSRFYIENWFFCGLYFSFDIFISFENRMFTYTFKTKAHTLLFGVWH